MANSLIDAAAKLKVCGHPLRLQILTLIEGQSQCVTELWQCLAQPQPVVSQHLAALKEKAIVDCRIEGNRRVYSIADPWVRQFVRGLMEP